MDSSRLEVCPFKGNVVYIPAATAWKWLDDRRNYVDPALYARRESVYIQGDVSKFNPVTGKLTIKFSGLGDGSKKSHNLDMAWYATVKGVDLLPDNAHVLTESDWIDWEKGEDEEPKRNNKEKEGD